MFLLSIAPSYSERNVLSFSDVTPNSINVTWPTWNQDNDVGSGPISEYQILIREAGQTQFSVFSAGMNLSYIFENLRENTEYEFCVVVFRNHATHGEGTPSNLQTQRTLPRGKCLPNTAYLNRWAIEGPFCLPKKLN